jgi:TonB family protein
LGILVRFSLLALGMRRLRHYRRNATVLAPPPRAFSALENQKTRPTVYLSTEISGPVTFGFRQPAILLPPEFLSAPESAQQAIACHELIHVRRADWAVTMIEEVIRAVLWFHPAIWWLIGDIQLSREQAVDAAVLRVTAAPKQYIDALLAVAEGRLQPDLAPAPLFLRKTHLTQRVTLILKEVSMSKRRLLSSLAAVCGALMVTARFAILLFPISAPAQDVVRGEANLLHRTPVVYPPEAREKGIEGTVVVEATLNDGGVVTDARALSGPDPLRKAAIKSVLDWHYAARTQSPVEVAVDFKLPAKMAAPAAPRDPVSGTLKEIQFTGVSSSVREAVLNKLPVHEGDWLQIDMDPTGESVRRLREAIHEVDEHLGFNVRFNGRSELGLEISYRPQAQASDKPVPIRDAQGQVTRIRVGGNIQSAQVISSPKPKYPVEAKLAGIQGKVRLNVIINKDGTVQDVQVASGDPALSEVAVEAVRQWVYKPTLLNGQPVEVATVVDVNFTLAH